MKMKIAAAVACLAVCITAAAANNYFKPQAPVPEFAITAHAEMLEKDASVVIAPFNGWNMGGDDENGEVSYDICHNLKCEGEDIEKITYSINKGAFQIAEPPGKSIIVDKKECERLNVGGVAIMDNDKQVSENTFATQYTVDYDNQESDSTYISICGVVQDKDIFNAIWENEDEYVRAAAYDKMLEGVEITCTAVFTDGTSKSKVIDCGGEVMSYGQAGVVEKVHPDYDKNGAFFVFRLK